MKIRSDLYFLLLIDAEGKVGVFSERDMLDQFKREVEGGRVPSEIEFAFAEIPAELRRRLEKAREKEARRLLLLRLSGVPVGAWTTSARARITLQS